MFLKQCKVLFTPLIVIVMIALGLGHAPSLIGGQGGSFVWEVLLGASLGIVLALLSSVYGSSTREYFGTQRWFACVLLVAVIVYQYMAAFSGLYVRWLTWLNYASMRVPFAEGALLGYCVIGAIRAKR